MSTNLKSRQLLCVALNRLFWKCPIPDYYESDRNDWAEYWLAELRDGPEGRRITGVKWDRRTSDFVPCRERKG